MVVAIIIGQPLSMTSCSDLPKQNSQVLLPIASNKGQTISYVVLTGAGQATCYELMALWGLTIALCILLAASAITAGFLYLGKRRAQADFTPDNESEIEMSRSKGSFSHSPSPPMSPAFGGEPAMPAGAFGHPQQHAY